MKKCKRLLSILFVNVLVIMTLVGCGNSKAGTSADNIQTEAPIGEYRVHNVMIYNKETNEWEDLKLDGGYNLAGYNYTLRDLGDGFAMFDGAVNVLDYVMEDYMVLANYVQGFENGAIGADNSPLLKKYSGLIINYSDTPGSGRIMVE